VLERFGVIFTPSSSNGPSISRNATLGTVLSFGRPSNAYEKRAAHNLKGLFVPIHRHRLLSPNAQRAQIVKAHYVIGVGMCQQHRFELFNSSA